MQKTHDWEHYHIYDQSYYSYNIYFRSFNQFGNHTVHRVINNSDTSGMITLIIQGIISFCLCQQVPWNILQCTLEIFVLLFCYIIIWKSENSKHISIKKPIKHVSQLPLLFYIWTYEH